MLLDQFLLLSCRLTTSPGRWSLLAQLIAPERVGSAHSRCLVAENVGEGDEVLGVLKVGLLLARGGRVGLIHIRRVD